jgi:hypothetical protein
MLRWVPTGLQQPRAVVVHIEPLLLPILIEVDELVRQVPHGSGFAHLNTGATNYLGVIYVGLWLQPQEVPKEYSV